MSQEEEMELSHDSASAKVPGEEMDKQEADFKDKAKVELECAETEKKIVIGDADISEEVKFILRKALRQQLDDVDVNTFPGISKEFAKRLSVPCKQGAEVKPSGIDNVQQLLERYNNKGVEGFRTWATLKPKYVLVNSDGKEMAATVIEYDPPKVTVSMSHIVLLDQDGIKSVNINEEKPRVLIPSESNKIHFNEETLKKNGVSVENQGGIEFFNPHLRTIMNHLQWVKELSECNGAEGSDEQIFYVKMNLQW